MRIVRVAVLAAAFSCILVQAQTTYRPTAQELARWHREAAAITIARDNWGIAHVHGYTDADAVFGMEYAQAEDDFNRVEANYLNSLGWLSQAEGEQHIYVDLRQQLFMDPAVLKQKFARSPAWLQSLMNAFADGLNFYLYKHPEVHPRVITHFEPWMALSFTEGSIGGDIERIHPADLATFYGGAASASLADAEHPRLAGNVDDTTTFAEPTGSNGIAIAPANTVDHHALLLINPHTSFFFRSELQMSSDEGINAYGAVTWGQFFVYQGFNSRIGWMHTSSGVDAVDEYLETVSKLHGKWFYKFGTDERPVRSRVISILYKTPSGMERKSFTAYFTQHGPIIGTRIIDGQTRWVAIRLMQRPIRALEQSYLRTKAHDYKSYYQTMLLYANSSNNTIFADADGDIAYFQGNYIPRRDIRFDWTKPVDGSNPATEYQGLLSVEETPHLLNPHSGWIYNSNNWPWSAAGPDSPKRADYPAYVEQGTESARGLHAVRLLTDRTNFSLDSLMAAAYDSYLPWFARTIPVLVRAWDNLPVTDPLRANLGPQIAVLRNWDLRWGKDSVATSLAVFWGREVSGRAVHANRGDQMLQDWVVEHTTPAEMLAALGRASTRLTEDFGSWRTPWGAINRYQRVNGDLAQPFSDALPSIPIPFTSSLWGSLASFGARPYRGTKKWYGTSGNSFVAVVEFGPRVRARAVTCGGESGHPSSPHFNDEAQRYADGNLRMVYYYPDELKGHVERAYHPGE